MMPKNKKWHDMYMFDVPVGLFADTEVEIFRHRVNDEAVLAKISERLALKESSSKEI